MDYTSEREKERASLFRFFLSIRHMGMNQDKENGGHSCHTHVQVLAFHTLEGVGLKPASVSATRKVYGQAFNFQFVVIIINLCGNL